VLSQSLPIPNGVFRNPRLFRFWLPLSHWPIFEKSGAWHQSSQYVKVCSLYGAGFYYMPGTDMCIKIGGWTRMEATYGANGNLAWGPFNTNQNTRATNDLTVRARGYITADAREQTAYGVARGYIAVGIATSDVGTGASEGTFSSNRAYVQWAGFTAGLATSFYDFYSAAAQNYRAGYLPQEDTGDGGWWVFGYTAQFGGGLSATLSAEMRRMTQIYDDTGPAAAASMTPMTGGSVYGGFKAPDVVANLRADQAWGSAQIMGALHEVNPLYYGQANQTMVPSVDAINGGPGNQWGWVVGAGLKLNASAISQGDYIMGEANYTQGAMKYIANTSGTTQTDATGGAQSYGVMTDCVYGGTTAATETGCQLTTGWSAIVSYEHYWTPQWHQSFTGAYMDVSYDGQANAMLCQLEGQGGAVSGSGAVAAGGCNNSFQYWGVGSRLQWDITKSFYIGVEALYLQQVSASSATGLVPTAVGLGDAAMCDTGTCTNQNQSNWVFTFRMHKDFLP
jgi:hypothetical protein